MEIAHTLFGVFDAAVRLGESHKTGDFIGIDRASLHLSGQRQHVDVTGGVERMYHGQRQFAFGHIVACGFSDF